MISRKIFFKLMNNSVFGKTMDNLRKRENIKLYSSYEKFVKESSRPTFVDARKFNDNLYAVHSIKEVLVLNKPCYVGASILELSKHLMYDFHYNVIQKLYKDNKLLFTDTNSLCYSIKTQDIYEDLYNSERKDLFDNADYDDKSPYFFKHNKKFIGKMKDETKGKPISEFVGLKSKMYSFICAGEETKKCKGVVENVVSKELKLDYYKDILFNSSQMYNTMMNIRSNDHKIKTLSINKISLSSFDNKRYILDDGISTTPYT